MTRITRWDRFQFWVEDWRHRLKGALRALRGDY